MVVLGISYVTCKAYPQSDIPPFLPCGKERKWKEKRFKVDPPHKRSQSLHETTVKGELLMLSSTKL